MPTRRIDFGAVRKIGLALPRVEESTTYGSPCLKVRGKLIACLAVHKSSEPNSLSVRVDMGQRAEMIADDPETYYLTSHYVNYPFVLVRLSHIHRDALRDLLGTAWRLASEKAVKSKRKDVRMSGRKDVGWLQSPRNTTTGSTRMALRVGT